MKKPTHAVRFRNNWDGEGDIEYRFVYVEKGRPIDFESEQPLFEYEGDKILKAWKLK